MKKNKRAITGIILLDKEKGMSSNFLLQKVRYLYQAQKAGHSGTLDPFAEGVLPILLGEATKFGSYLLGTDKKYRVNIKFGAETTTDDLEGDILKEAPIPNLHNLEWDKILEDFVGEIEQIPPIYSALKIKGQRAYDLARKGEKVELEPRIITIYDLKIIELFADSLILEVHCSSGTYIRALARDLGRKIGSAAYAQQLRRLAVGNFSAPLYKLAELENKNLEVLDNLLLSLDDNQWNLAKLEIPEEKLRFIKNGNDIFINNYPNGEYALYYQNKFLGVGKVKDLRLYPQRMIKI